MDIVSLLEIYDRAFSQCKGTHQDKAKAASDAVLACFLQHAPEAESLHDEVSQNVTRYGKVLHFDVSTTNDVNYTAFTNEYNKDITIKIKPSVQPDEMNSIFIHELGEADYIARGLPDIIDHRDREIVRGRLIELFSHPHALSLTKIHQLDPIELAMRTSRATTWITHGYVKEYHYKWFIVLMLSWAIVSFPSLLPIREELDGYLEHKEFVDQIVSICNATNTMGTKHEVEIAMQEVIRILESLGMEGIEMKKNSG
ncbi:hypothetical protein [Cohnella cholangitidis]|uniref:Uncharacterized protein n=1 Tax=Cohnella cholangitidis TaxID=2598458 RepID=A0A7G5C0E7_9BACL|nr:hypothetical protein [Cohnella cholangitidis]QMV42681.1 hypothetical protein FPL14_16910 [Cohnella cholangitidis]